MSKLTATSVKQAKIEDKQYKMTDGAGMYLLVKKSGKYWRLDYRFDGKRKTLALGRYPELSLKESRSKRDDARKLLSNNIDPGAKRKAEKIIRKLQVENSFEAIGREWFEKKKKEWSESHSKRIIKRLENNVFPYMGM
jgi:Txe/YoeB family toxin of Txe-Axe toxin-antitoxin module